jgi:lipid A ethanolaminephosphotransferase
LRTLLIADSAIDQSRCVVQRLMGFARTSNRYFPSGIAVADARRNFRLPVVDLRSDAVFAFAMSALWLVLYNARFWTDTVAAMWHGNAGSAFFFVSFFVFVLCIQALLLLLLPSRRLMIGGASMLFLVAALSSYFSAKFGVVMNKDMLRNAFETDTAESRGLLTFELLARFVAMGIVPAIAVWRVRLPRMRALQGLRHRLFWIGVILIVCTCALLSASASYAVFFREHKPIRYALMPAAPVTSALAVLFDKNTGERGPLVNASGPAQRTVTPRARPLVIVMVVGETARAANFELGGYARPTNPELSTLDGLVYFSETTSCGTATAISVPCMFSHFSRRDFGVDDAAHYANLLDALKEAGLDVEWRDNNAGCKGVCARISQIDYGNQRDPRLCSDGYCYDEVLITDLPARLESITQDTVIVMHQIGSHGPAYAERYPPEFEKFKPACRSNQLQRCTPQEVINAYDNTIAYTDHVLARTVDALRAASSRIDGLMIYASDHGESLGEQGLYLHGLPYTFAPETQKHVPMLMWLSPTYALRTGVTMNCLQARATQAFSHDNIYHTLLGAAEVVNNSYDAELDILADCRKPHWPSNHE